MTHLNAFAHAVSKKLSLAAALLLAASTVACGAATRPATHLPVQGDEVVVVVEGQGRVTTASGDLDCSDSDSQGSCRMTRASVGDPVLEAEPARGWQFSRWEVSRVDESGEADRGFLDASFQAPERAYQYRAVFVRGAVAQAKRAR